jgi:hypothetical protein
MGRSGLGWQRPATDCCTCEDEIEIDLFSGGKKSMQIVCYCPKIAQKSRSSVIQWAFSENCDSHKNLVFKGGSDGLILPMNICAKY